MSEYHRLDCQHIQVAHDTPYPAPDCDCDGPEVAAELALLRRVAEAAEKALYRGKPETTPLDDLEFDENGDPTELFDALAAWKASRTS